MAATSVSWPLCVCVRMQSLGLMDVCFPVPFCFVGAAVVSSCPDGWLS